MIRVLLIEDDPGQARLVKQYLVSTESASFQVEHADRLKVGIERLDEGGIDVILTDLNLPDSVGLETFHAIHDHAPDLPIVVLSGYEDEAAALEAVQAGAQDYLVKGALKPEYLSRTLRYAIARHKQLLGGLLAQSSRAAGRADPAPPSPSHSVLLIEPREADREVVKVSLAGGDLRLFPVSTGQEGIEQARVDLPALIILDIDLPDMAGEEVLRLLKQDPMTATIPVVMTSSYISPRAAQQLRDDGAAACISKPLDAQYLLRTVREFTSD